MTDIFVLQLGHDTIFESDAAADGFRGFGAGEDVFCADADFSTGDDDVAVCLAAAGRALGFGFPAEGTSEID